MEYVESELCGGRVDDLHGERGLAGEISPWNRFQPLGVAANV